MVVSPVVKQGRHEIQFECLMSDVQLSTDPGNDVLFDVIWYIHKSGRKREVHREETVPGPLIMGQSVLLNYQGLNVNVGSLVIHKLTLATHALGNGKPVNFVLGELYLLILSQHF